MTARETQSELARIATLEVRARDILLWDGDCELCRRAVAWIRERDPDGRFLPLPYQAAPLCLVGQRVKLAAAHTVHVLLPSGEIRTSGRAVLYVLSALGHKWPRLLERRPLVWAVELGYFVVSRNRYRLSHLLFREDEEKDKR